MKQAVKKYLFLFLLFLFTSKSFAGNGKADPQNTIRFTENKNQWDKQVLYRAQLDGGALFLEKNCFTYNFYDKETLRENHVDNSKRSANLYFIRSHAFRMTFVNAEKTVETSAQQTTLDYCNYFIGKDPNKWVGGAKNYKEVNYKNLYHGIDLQVLGYENSLKYNFIVSKGTNATDIQLFYEGLENIQLERGALKLKTSINEMVEQHPYAYQWIGGKRVEIPCEFVLKNTTVQFDFPNGYDKSYELVIDPVLIFAASSGSYADNFGHTATFDVQGNLYSGGIAFSQGYPTTLGAFDDTYNGGDIDAVITKYDASGIVLQYSTYLGGGVGSEIVTSLIIDAQNNLLLYGVTGSSDFPISSSTYNGTFNGGTPYYPHGTNGNFFEYGTDIYVAKFNAAGTSLLASTFIGGSMNDGVNCKNQPTIFVGYQYNPITMLYDIPVYTYSLDSLQYNYGDYYRGEIELDKFGNIVITTSTRSSDFPIVNGFDNTLNGEQDAVVFKMNNNLTQLIWSTYLGGSDNDAGYGLVLDDSANVYVTGGTASASFPTTAGSLQPTYNGGKTDGYITAIKNDGTAILFSTFWGTPAYDQSFFIELDNKNDVYILGQSEGAMPITTGVYSSPGGQFITKMNDSLNTLIFATVYGNGNSIPTISPTAFLVDNCENIYAAGWATAFNSSRPLAKGMPITLNAHDTSSAGYDFHLIVLTTDAQSLLYGTYMGGDLSGEHVHGGTSRYDKKGIVYQSLCAGCGSSQDFKTYPYNAWPYYSTTPNDSTFPNRSNCNNAVFKFDFQAPIADANFTADHLQGCAPLTIQFNNQSTPGGTYLWDFGNNDTTSSVFNPVKTYTDPGVYKVQLLINNPAKCNIWDTAFQYVTVYPSFSADFDYITTPCSNLVSFNDSSKTAPAFWSWDFDDNTTSTLQNPTHTYSTPGTYDVTLITSTINGCKDTTVVQLDLPIITVSISPGKNICTGNSVQLNATGGFSYSWSPASELNNGNIPNPVATPSVTTTYTVTISTINSNGDTCLRTLSTTIFVFNPVSYPLTATVDQDTIFEGDSTHIHALTDTTLTIIWSPANGLNDPASFDPIAKPDKTTTYTVTILDSTGCSRSASVTIYVISLACNEDDVFVPNTFTPNGDGHNDILYVRSNSLINLYFAVYNRWGQLVFETTDIHIGWDGIYKGMKADPAVFAWYLRGECYNKNKFKTQGNVTLIR